jgi:hypothetical protein
VREGRADALTWPDSCSTRPVMRVGHLILVALTAAACSSSDNGPCAGNFSCPAWASGESLPGRLYGAKSITTEPPCQVTLTQEVPASLFASLAAGTTMATCPLHVHFADRPDLDSTITIFYMELACCGSGWSFLSPLFSDQTSRPDASLVEASEDVDASEPGDASPEPDATGAVDASLDKEALDKEAIDASIE